MLRKKILLFALIGVFGLSLGYRLMHPYRQESVSQLRYTGDRPTPERKAKLETPGKKTEGPLGVLLPLFLDPPRPSPGVGRNLFSEAETRGREARITLPVVKEIAKPPIATPLEDTRVRVSQEIAQFKVFGFYRSKGETVIFLERENEILVVREGDRIDGKYLVKRIEKETMILRAEQLQEDFRIDLSELSEGSGREAL
jgi:hypothetical protein